MPNRSEATPAGTGRKKRGCLFWGCIVAAGLLVLTVAVVGLVACRVKQIARAVTASAPAAIEVYTPSRDEASRVEAKVRSFLEAMHYGRAGTFRFSGQELNTAVAIIPDGNELRGKAFFVIDGNRIRAQTSLPLGQIPGLQGRFLNGTVDLDVSCRNGFLEVYVRDIATASGEIPEALKARLRGVNLAAEILKRPGAADTLSRIDSIEISNGELVVCTRAHR